MDQRRDPGRDKNDPLVSGDVEVLTIGVDVERRENAVGDAVFEDEIVFGDGSVDAELTVELHSDDFDIEVTNPTFRLKAAGKSQNKARVPDHAEARRSRDAHRDDSQIAELRPAADDHALGRPGERRTAVDDVVLAAEQWRRRSSRRER